MGGPPIGGTRGVCCYLLDHDIWDRLAIPAKTFDMEQPTAETLVATLSSSVVIALLLPEPAHKTGRVALRSHRGNVKGNVKRVDWFDRLHLKTRYNRNLYKHQWESENTSSA